MVLCIRYCVSENINIDHDAVCQGMLNSEWFDLEWNYWILFKVVGAEVKI